MKKIFISHNQAFAGARPVKQLINMFGAHAILVEDEPGAEPPDQKSLRLLAEADAFLALCTQDLCDAKTGVFNPKSNVSIEIAHWQEKHGFKNMVILKENGCSLPVLLKNPTYHGFEGISYLDAIQRALVDFQSSGIIVLPQAAIAAIPVAPKAPMVSDREKDILLLLANSEDGEYKDVLRRKFSITEAQLKVSLVHLKSLGLAREIQRYIGEDAIVQATSEAFKYLASQNLIAR